MDAILRQLLEASATLAGEHDVKRILHILTDVTKVLLQADICSIFLHDADHDQLWTIVADYINEIRISCDTGIAGHVFRTRETVNIADAYSDPRFSDEVDRRIGYRTKTVLAMPLVNRYDQHIGVVEVINRRDGQSFSAEDSNLLRHIVLYISSTVENAVLSDRLKKSQEEIIYRLTNVTRFKDPETRHHILRVGLISAELARRAGMDPGDCETIRLAAPMHDIGKIGIPDRILLKEGKLDLDEWHTMQTHARVGYEILQGGGSALSETAALIALEHHEHWDGNGYPDGKRGTGISLVGRITAIADVFDALLSRRPYKHAWPADKALEYIRRERGEHFDPELADLFLEAEAAMRAIEETWADDDEQETMPR